MHHCPPAVGIALQQDREMTSMPACLGKGAPDGDRWEMVSYKQIGELFAIPNEHRRPNQDQPTDLPPGRGGDSCFEIGGLTYFERDYLDGQRPRDLSRLTWKSKGVGRRIPEETDSRKSWDDLFQKFQLFPR